MAIQKFYKLTMTASVALMVAFVTQAAADGMPYGQQQPAAAASPLDQALDSLQSPAPPAEAPPQEMMPAAQEAATPAPQNELPPPVPETRVVEVQPNTSFFGLSVGMYDLTHGKSSTAFNLEFQPGVKIAGTLQPLFGAFLTTSGSLMGYAGVGVPVHLSDRIVMMPSISGGYYKEGDGYDLDRNFALRVGTELSYEFDDKSRLGLNAHVISNGTSLGREDWTDMISLVYTMPLNMLAGGASPMASTLSNNGNQ